MVARRSSPTMCTPMGRFYRTALRRCASPTTQLTPFRRPSGTASSANQGWYSGAPPPLARDHPFGSDALRATRPTVADRADQRRRRIASAFATDARRSRRGRGGSVLSDLGLAPIFRSQNRVGFSMDSVARGIDPSTAQWWSTCQWPRCAASDRSSCSSRAGCEHVGARWVSFRRCRCGVGGDCSDAASSGRCWHGRSRTGRSGRRPIRWPACG